MKGKSELTLQVGPVLKVIPLKLFLECTRIQKSQGGLQNLREVLCQGFSIMLTAQVTKQRVFVSTKTSTKYAC